MTGAPWSDLFVKIQSLSSPVATHKLSLEDNKYASWNQLQDAILKLAAAPTEGSSLELKLSLSYLSPERGMAAGPASC
jgi:hypothetical protein